MNKEGESNVADAPSLTTNLGAKMKTRHLTAFFAVAFTAILCADEDVPIGCKRIEYTINSNNAVVVEVENIGDGVYARPRVLRAVTFLWDGNIIAVPTNILTEMCMPQLASIDIKAGAYYGGVNGNADYRLFSITVCDPRFDDDRVLHPDRKLRVCFLLWSGRLREVDLAMRGGEHENPFLFDSTIWHADQGYSWRGVHYTTLGSVLDAMDAGRKRQPADIVDPLAKDSAEETNRQKPGAIGGGSLKLAPQWRRWRQEKK